MKPDSRAGRARPDGGPGIPLRREVGGLLAIALAGPALGLLLWAFGVVVAPPWTSLTGLLYLPLAGLGLPLGIVAFLARWVRLRGLLGALILASAVLLVYMAALGPRLPGGMTNCQPLASDPPQVGYACVSTSSDDPGYRYEFSLQGRAGWPLIRLVHDSTH